MNAIGKTLARDTVPVNHDGIASFGQKTHIQRRSNFAQLNDISRWTIERPTQLGRIRAGDLNSGTLRCRQIKGVRHGIAPV